MIITERQALIALSNVPVLTARRAHQLIEYFGSAKALWGSHVDEWPDGIGKDAKRDFKRLQSEFSYATFVDSLRIMDAKAVTVIDDDYPNRLRMIADAPVVLYVRGQLTDDNLPHLAVVGSRKRTNYGQSAVNKIMPHVLAQGMVIVSGLAYGIDSDAHRCTLANNGVTLAVLGSGLDQVYPVQNRALVEKICKRGAVVSEYPPGFSARRWTFPARNRIIAGLSQAVLVVEAGEKSGALITADFAMDFGRDVYAIPGSIHSNMSKGTNKLIQQGAKMILTAEDILEEYFIKQTDDEAPRQLPLLDAKGQRVIEQLSHQPVHIDRIAQGADFPIGLVLSTLTMLVLQGLVIEYDGNRFALSHLYK